MDSDAKTVDAEAPEREALERPQWLEAAIRERGQIGRKKLYRMRPEGMDVLDTRKQCRFSHVDWYKKSVGSAKHVSVVRT